MCVRAARTLNERMICAQTIGDMALCVMMPEQCERRCSIVARDDAM